MSRTEKDVCHDPVGEVLLDTRWTHNATRMLRAVVHTSATKLAGKLLCAVSFATLAACSDSNPAAPVTPDPSPNDPVSGAFTLNTVNTNTLPYTLLDDSGFKLEIASSTIALQAGGQFVLAVTTRETVAGFASLYVDSTFGTWQQQAGAVTLTDGGGTSSPATWDGVRLAFTMENDDGTLALVYRKEP